jgi:hypothetical protein
MMTIEDMGNHLQLITDSQDIDAVLESLGRTDLREEVGLLFVEVLDGEYGAVYYCEYTVPRLHYPVNQIQEAHQ